MNIGMTCHVNHYNKTLFYFPILITGIDSIFDVSQIVAEIYDRKNKTDNPISSNSHPSATAK